MLNRVIAAKAGGSRRQGQVDLTNAVSAAFGNTEHLAAQAGTGTGKSIGYVVGAVTALEAGARRVLLSTSNKALQTQLYKKDIPLVIEALYGDLDRGPRFALLKGRDNYLCRRALKDRIRKGDKDVEELGLEKWDGEAIMVNRSNPWTMSGERVDLGIPIPDRVWRQVSVSGLECPGAANCGYGETCFFEDARKKAEASRIIVVNHAQIAVNATIDADVLPEHDFLVVDEAHEFINYFEKACTSDLSRPLLRSMVRWVEQLGASVGSADLKLRVEDMVTAIEGETEPRFVEGIDEELEKSLRALGAAVVDSLEAMKNVSGEVDSEVKSRAFAALTDVENTVVRILGVFQQPESAREEAVVFEKGEAKADGHDSDAVGFRDTWPILRVAPLFVDEKIRNQLLSVTPTVLTSATLTVGDGLFDAVFREWGLDSNTRCVDVESPFDYTRNGLLYVAGELPNPGYYDPPEYRRAAELAKLDEMEALIRASDGRALVLFTAYPTMQAFAGELRGRLGGYQILCQGENGADLPNLIERFKKDPKTVLLGVDSLWQGLDVPGASLSLVIIHKLPFPYFKAPMHVARERALTLRGYTDEQRFKELSLDPATIRLRQGVGRLLRDIDDEGVVAILDPRLWVTDSCRQKILPSLPPFTATLNLNDALIRLRSLAR
jgi:ATP-dependent DNA helicase DinG